MDSLERRVDILERLPERMTALETQIVQLRDEIRSEFSAIRTEFRSEFSVIRTEIREVDTGLTNEMHAGDTETRRLMRVLHEDLVQRIATIKDG
jgi:hypothetical protein